ncbi:hypothetical protein [Actinoplanes aureus]|uniref:Uncharacterized protein n=1 Tax=Actinoplanes aureus TaxID=2792083 RepID=A0A931CQC9_9ACTN|nr:hypothetical protein [Actinoplanes aureus]MBG0569185.1 hypothetical protein [Actinoplanes aureus]
MPTLDVVPNTLFRDARRRLFGSRQALADAVNQLVPDAYRVSDNDIGKIERGQVTWPRQPRRNAYRQTLQAATDEDLGLFDKRGQQPTAVARPVSVVVGEARLSPANIAHKPATVAGSAESGTPRSIDSSSADLESIRDRGDTGEMIRRTVLLALAAAGSPLIGAARPTPPVADRERDVLTADIDHWQEAVWEYGYDYHLARREKLLVDIGRDQEALRRQLAGHLAAGKAVAQPAAAVAAQLTSLMALICTDLGYAREARHLWRFARRYADLSQDSAVRLWVSGHEITSGIYQRRPLPVLAELAQRAISSSPNSAPSAGKAEILGGQAQVLSLLGRPREAHSALDELRKTYAHLPSACTTLRDSFFGWPEHRLHHAASFTYSMTGSTAKAIDAQESALKLYPDSRRIARCQISLHRARCLIINGEMTEGLRQANNAVASTDLTNRKEFVLAVADHVFETVPSRERGRAEAREFGDLLRISRSTLRG